MRTGNHHRIAWIVPAFLALLGLFALIRGTMPGLVFSSVLVALALFCAAKAYGTGRADRSPSTTRITSRGT